MRNVLFLYSKYQLACPLIVLSLVINKSSKCWMWLYKISWKSLIEAFNGWNTQCQLWTFFTFVMIYKQSLQVDDGEIYQGSQGSWMWWRAKFWAILRFYLKLSTSGHTRRNLHDASVFIRINRGCGQGCNLPEKAQASLDTQSRRSVKHLKNRE